jgi:phosphohistidine phosphatase
VKTLYIIRHAKSSWVDVGLRDFDRPLSERGEKDAPRMGKRLKERAVVPDLLLSSPAKRAIKTGKFIAKALDYPKEKIVQDKRLYHADADAILAILSTMNDAHDTVLLFGHNPGLTEFANMLLNQTIMNIPTTGVVAGRLSIVSWKNVKPGCGKMIFFDFPKSKAEPA